MSLAEEIAKIVMLKRKSFRWNGKDVDTFSELAHLINMCSTKIQCETLMAVCIDVFGEDKAKFIIGYLLGYEKDTYRRHQLMAWFSADHPVFGKRTPSLEEGLEMSLMQVHLWLTHSKYAAKPNLWPVEQSESEKKSMERDSAEWY